MTSHCTSFGCNLFAGTREETRRILCLLFLWLACSSSVLGGGSVIKETELPTRLFIKTIELQCSIDPSWKASLTRYAFPNQVVDVQADSGGTRLGVLWRTTTGDVLKLSLFSLPDLRQLHSFTVPNGAQILELQATWALLRADDETVFFRYDFPKDAFVSGTFCGLQSDKLVTYEEDSIAVRNKVGGSLLWKQEKKDCEPDFVFPNLDQHHVLWLKDGLWCMSVPDSSIWSFGARVLFKTSAIGAAFANVVLGAMGAIMVGVATGSIANAFGIHPHGYYYPSYHWDPGMSAGVELFCSNPLLIGREVYFASEDSLSCLSIVDGKPKWQTRVTGHRKSAYLSSFGNGVGVLVEQREPWFVTAFNLLSGDSLWRFELDSDHRLKEAVMKDSSICILTDKTLYVIGSKGQFLVRSDFNDEWKPVSYLVRDTMILVIGKGQIGAWGLSSDQGLLSLWEKKTKKLLGVAEVGSGFVLCWDEDDSLRVLSMRTGQCFRATELRLGRSLISKGGGFLFFRSENSLGVLSLDALLKGLPDL